MSHPNEELLRRGYAAFAVGDVDTVLSLFADDIVFHIGGESLISGDYHGHQEVLGFLGKVVDLTGGTFRLDVHDVLANDEHGAVLVTAHGERNGKTLAVREVNTWHLANGKCTEFWNFLEHEQEADEFFS